MHLLRLLTILLVIFSFTSIPCTATPHESKDFIWSDIKDITQIGAKRATLETNWKNGKMHLVLELEDFSKELAQCRDVQIRFPILVDAQEPVFKELRDSPVKFSEILKHKIIKDKKQPILHLHMNLTPYFNPSHAVLFHHPKVNGVENERTQICKSSVEIDESNYKRLVDSGRWEIGITKRFCTKHGGCYMPDGYMEFDVEHVYDPRQWYEIGGKVKQENTRDVCRILTKGRKHIYGDRVWYKETFPKNGMTTKDLEGPGKGSGD